MGRRIKNDFYRELVLLFEAAVRALRLLPRDGCYPAGFRSSMPTPVREWWDVYNTEVAKTELRRARFAVTRADIARLETALRLLNGASLTDFDRGLIWDRAKGESWKALADRHGQHASKLRRHHFLVMAEITSYAIAQQRKSRGQKSSGRISRFTR